MCNLSQGIREDAREDAQAEIIMNMYKKGFTLEQITEVTEKSVEEIKAIIKSGSRLWHSFQCLTVKPESSRS